MKKQRTVPPQFAGDVSRTAHFNLWGTQAEDRTPSVYRGLYQRSGPPQSAGDPSRAQASGSWGCMWGLVLHSTPPAQLLAPIAEWPHLAYDMIVGIQGLSHAFQLSTWLRDSEILEKSSHTTAVISASSWPHLEEVSWPLATPWDL